MLSVWIDTFQKMYGLVYQSLRSIERQKDQLRGQLSRKLWMSSRNSAGSFVKIG